MHILNYIKANPVWFAQSMVAMVAFMAVMYMAVIVLWAATPQAWW